jgi:hypothetical protein
VIHQINIKKQSEYWLSLDGFSFEREISNLYKSLGYKVKNTKKVADGGIDIKLWNDKGEYIIVQCKNHTHKVAPSIVRDLYGTMHKEKANKSILISSSGFNTGVYKFSKELPIELLDINDLISLSEKAYPKSLEIINNVKNLFSINANITFKFKSIGNVYLLYVSFGKALYNEEKNTVILKEPIANGCYIFESIEEGRCIADTILKQKYKPFEKAIYEIVEWKIYHKDSLYSYKTFYYVKIVKKGEEYFLSKKKNENQADIVSEFPKPQKRKKQMVWLEWI